MGGPDDKGGLYGKVTRPNQQYSLDALEERLISEPGSSIQKYYSFVRVGRWVDGTLSPNLLQIPL
jgi:hypothetical protein